MAFKRHSDHALTDRSAKETEWIQNHANVGSKFKVVVVDIPSWWQLVSRVSLLFLILGFRVVLAESAVLSRCIIVLTTCRGTNFGPTRLLAVHKKHRSNTSISCCFHLPLIASPVCWGPLWQYHIFLTPALIVSVRSRATFKEQFFYRKIWII